MISNASSSLEIQGLISLLWRAIDQSRTRPICSLALALRLQDPGRSQVTAHALHILI